MVDAYPSSLWTLTKWLTLLAVAVLYAVAVEVCQAQEVDWVKVEQTLVAEAASEGYLGMLGVAEVMRERGWSLRPFCASRRKDLAQFVARQGAKVRQQAHQAVEAAKAGSRTVKGSTHYENIEAFGVPSWAKGQPVVAKVGHHTFYRLD